MTTALAANDAITKARLDYADRHVESRQLHLSASKVLPGGNTRTLFHHPPFPLTFVRGHKSTLVDADGHEYHDLLGDYTAGLMGHSDRRVRDAAMRALEVNTSVGGIHPAEQELGRLMCDRFGLDLVRFTNSGSEANLMAMTAARMYTGRSKIMVMHGAYHGGLMYFGHGPAPWNVPYPIVLGLFNDLAACQALITEHADDLAAVLIEPMLGSAGCLPADPSFLRGLADTARSVGALAIMDEVMTSRHGPHGLSELWNVQADLKTFGKYIAGGFSFGAFGGTAEVMGIFDGGREDHVPHAGTFNNNITSVSAGVEVLSNIFTADVAVEFTARGEEFMANIAQVLARHPLPMCVTGYGTMMVIHTCAAPPTNGEESLHKDYDLQELLFLGLLRRGYYIAPRGMINISLPVTDDQLAGFLTALDDLCLELVTES
jgi:glutamate-1-semialdehyde 2,1-aminomutase